MQMIKYFACLSIIFVTIFAISELYHSNKELDLLIKRYEKEVDFSKHKQYNFPSNYGSVLRKLKINPKYSKEFAEMILGDSDTYKQQKSVRDFEEKMMVIDRINRYQTAPTRAFQRAKKYLRELFDESVSNEKEPQKEIWNLPQAGEAQKVLRMNFHEKKLKKQKTAYEDDDVIWNLPRVGEAQKVLRKNKDNEYQKKYFIMYPKYHISSNLKKPIFKILRKLMRHVVPKMHDQRKKFSRNFTDKKTSRNQLRHGYRSIHVHQPVYRYPSFYERQPNHGYQPLHRHQPIHFHHLSYDEKRNKLNKYGNNVKSKTYYRTEERKKYLEKLRKSQNSQVYNTVTYSIVKK